jgi:hypothetical protein
MAIMDVGVIGMQNDTEMHFCTPQEYFFHSWFIYGEVIWRQITCDSVITNKM